MSSANINFIFFFMKIYANIAGHSITHTHTHIYTHASRQEFQLLTKINCVSWHFMYLSQFELTIFHLMLYIIPRLLPSMLSSSQLLMNNFFGSFDMKSQLDNLAVSILLLSFYIAQKHTWCEFFITDQFLENFLMDESWTWN